MTPDTLAAVRAVARDTIGVPNASDRELSSAEKAGLIRFKPWPSGHWSLTPAGRAHLVENDDG